MKQFYKISEFSKISGLPIRTLHYYDEINLLNPKKISDRSYRFYDDEQLIISNRIKAYRKLNIPLTTIKKMLQSPDLMLQREILIQKKTRVGL